MTVAVSTRAEDLALAEAVEADQLDAARAALAAGADVQACVRIARLHAYDPRMYPGRTALGWAKSVAMAELLLDAGAEVDSPDETGVTPLRRAVPNAPHLGELIALLLRRGASARTVGLSDAYRGGPALVQLLLDAGAPVTRAALYDYRNTPEVLALLEDAPIRNAVASVETKQLMRAARTGNLEAIAAALRQGASAAARDTNGMSAIDHARATEHKEAAIALERGLVANQPYAALFEAVVADDSVGIRRAVRTINIETPNERGETAMMVAARYSLYWSVRVLIDERAQVDHRALLAAIDAGDLDTMLLLIDRGAKLAEHAAALLAAACKQPDSDLLKHLLLRGLVLPPPPDPVSSDEGSRLLREARAGRLPAAGAIVASWRECPRCRDLPDSMGWCHSANGDQTGAPLPAATNELERFGWSRSGLWKCGLCDTYYDYEFDHDNGIYDGWDSEYLRRIDHAAARTYFTSQPPSSRITRELEALSRRQKFEEAAAAPGQVVHASGDSESGGRRTLAIYRLDADGAHMLAARSMLSGEHDATAAALTARGLRAAECDMETDLVWLCNPDGVEVYDAKARVLVAAGERATMPGETIVERRDITRVVAFADDDYVHRGIMAVLTSGVEQPLVSKLSGWAMGDYTYSRNELLFETVWCSTLGRALADWAGAPFENLV